VQFHILTHRQAILANLVPSIRDDVQHLFNIILRDYLWVRSRNKARRSA
jgi:hypothetical protein